jgi:hypothetical protein
MRDKSAGSSGKSRLGTRRGVSVAQAGSRAKTCLKIGSASSTRPIEAKVTACQ